MTSTVSNQTSSSAAAFLDSIGIGGEADATVASQLSYLGIKHFRTDMASSQDLLAAGALGAKMDVIVPWVLGAVTTKTLSNLLTTNINPAASVVEAVEGPNEVNYSPDTFNGVGGPAGFEAEQQQIYNLVKGDTALNSASKTTAVYNFTVRQGTAAGTYQNTSVDADDTNVHAYGGPGIPPAWILPYETKQYAVAGNKPVVLTETGAETMAGNGVDQAVQARYDIEALLDAFQLGVSRTYLYDIQDWASGDNATNFSAHYGLYNTDGSIKLAGTSIHNLTTILSQNATGSDTGASTLPYTLTNLPYYGHSELLQKGSGVFDLALWNETDVWNSATNTEIAIPSGQVTLTLASTFAKIAVYDPLVSSNPISTTFNASSVSVALSNDPLIVELTPQTISGIAPAARSTTTDTIKVSLSEDAWNGDAKFKLLLDGKAISPVEAVMTLHSSGLFQDFTFTLNIAAGAHTLGVDYVNDAWGGTAATDRNLYIGSMVVDDKSLTTSPIAMFKGGTTDRAFTI